MAGLTAYIPVSAQVVAENDSVAGASQDIAMTDNNVIIIPPLFNYPVAPEDLPDLQTKSDWLMDHFWDEMDLKSTESVNQAALNDAFSVYSTAMTYASRQKVLASIDALLKRLKGNPVKLLQFTKAAEEALYGPRAYVWIDEAYMPFLKALMSDKKISDSRRQRYAVQYELLKNNAIGRKIPKFRLTLRNGRHHDFEPTAPLTLIEFGNPDCDDCRFAKTKLSMATDLEDLVEQKQLEIVFIVPDAVPEDQPGILEQFKQYPEEWTAGISYGADEKLDLRRSPSFYIIGEKGEILAKNLSVSDAVDRLRGIIDERAAKESKKKK